MKEPISFQMNIPIVKFLNIQMYRVALNWLLGYLFATYISTLIEFFNKFSLLLIDNI